MRLGYDVASSPRTVISIMANRWLRRGNTKHKNTSKALGRLLLYSLYLVSEAAEAVRNK